jgi:histidinol phosphatase-like enzyme
VVAGETRAHPEPALKDIGTFGVRSEKSFRVLLCQVQGGLGSRSKSSFSMRFAIETAKKVPRLEAAVAGFRSIVVRTRFALKCRWKRPKRIRRASSAPPDMILHGPLSIPPLPGAGRPRRGLFIGRTGALLVAPEKIAASLIPKDLWSPEATRLLFRAGQRGWNLYLIGNEDRVALGRMSDAAWERFEADLVARLRGEGIPLVRHYACLDHPKGKGRHRRDSVFRFPNTGALFHAAQEDGIELRESWVIAGDVDELAAGWRAGCRTAQVGRGRARVGDLEVEPDRVAVDLARALAELLATDEYSCT